MYGWVLTQEVLETFTTTDRTAEQKLFAVLRSSYDYLSPEERLKFLDAAIILRDRLASQLTAVWEGCLLMHNNEHGHCVRVQRNVGETEAEWQGRRRRAAAEAAREMFQRLVDSSLISVVEQPTEPESWW